MNPNAEIVHDARVQLAATDATDGHLAADHFAHVIIEWDADFQRLSQALGMMPIAVSEAIATIPLEGVDCPRCAAQEPHQHRGAAPLKLTDLAIEVLHHLDQELVRWKAAAIALGAPRVLPASPPPPPGSSR